MTHLNNPQENKHKTGKTNEKNFEMKLAFHSSLRLSPPVREVSPIRTRTTSKRNNLINNRNVVMDLNRRNLLYFYINEKESQKMIDNSI